MFSASFFKSMDYPQVDDPETDTGRGKWKIPQIKSKTSCSSLASLFRSGCSRKTNNKDRQYLWINLLLHVHKYKSSENFVYLPSACHSPNPSWLSYEQWQHWCVHIFCIYFHFPCWSLDNTRSSLLWSQQKTQTHPFSLKSKSNFIKKPDWCIFVSNGKDWDPIMQTGLHGNEISAYIWPHKFSFC